MHVFSLWEMLWLFPFSGALWFSEPSLSFHCVAISSRINNIIKCIGYVPWRNNCVMIILTTHHCIIDKSPSVAVVLGTNRLRQHPSIMVGFGSLIWLGYHFSLHCIIWPPVTVFYDRFFHILQIIPYQLTYVLYYHWIISMLVGYPLYGLCRQPYSSLVYHNLLQNIEPICPTTIKSLLKSIS